jgi:hypothetical protein
VVDQVRLGHTDTGIPDGEDLVLLVRGDSDVEVLVVSEQGGVGEGGETDLVEGIGGVGDQFTKEDFLVGVEGVDDAGGDRKENTSNQPQVWRRGKRDLLQTHRSRSWVISAWKPKDSA